jgi:hypothetical protein
MAERLWCLYPFSFTDLQGDKIYFISGGHHKKRSFKEEFLEMLERNKIIYGDECLFEFFNNING